MTLQYLHETYKRIRTLQTDVISSLPVVVLMPHSACNCRCVMCDIWKDNKNLKQLTEDDICGLLATLRKLGTKQVAMSGGEALLNANFFRLCALLKGQGLKITLLSTGLTIKKHAEPLLQWVDELIVSLDGDAQIHDSIRNILGAFDKLRDGVAYLKTLRPNYPIAARTVIHRLNYKSWEAILTAAREMGIDRVSFLPADVSSHAFNRQMAWAQPKQSEILIPESELPGLHETITRLINRHHSDFASGFIAESPEKIMQIYQYYAAFYGLNPFPFRKCNAPWVSAVIEADGSVRPCFFHDVAGNIREEPLEKILNDEKALLFRKTLNTAVHPTCQKCVCALNLSPFAKLDR